MDTLTSTLLLKRKLWVKTKKRNATAINAVARRRYIEHVAHVMKLNAKIAIYIYNVLDVINGFVRKIAVVVDHLVRGYIIVKVVG